MEAALGFQLDAFVVHSLADSQLLRQMINRCFAGGRGRLATLAAGVGVGGRPP